MVAEAGGTIHVCRRYSELTGVNAQYDLYIYGLCKLHHIRIPKLFQIMRSLPGMFG